MKDYIDDKTKHKKKSKKQTPKKSKHKHDYEFIESETEYLDWYIIGHHVCKICGKVTSKTLKRRD